MNTWIAASNNYRAESQRQQHQTTALPDSKAQKEQESKIIQETIAQAIFDFEQFMKTHGQAVLELLTASKRHIVLTERNEGGGLATVYFIDGNGLHVSVEATGTRLAYLNQTPSSKIQTVSVAEAVTAAVIMSSKNPKELITWLRVELDKIANAAPVIK
jgi:hypothetical protein